MMKRFIVILPVIIIFLIAGFLNAEILELGTIDTPGDANDVVVVGDLAYVADNQAGLRIIDISNPEEPTEVGFFDTPGTALHVAISGDYAYVADGPGGLCIVDISEPSSDISRCQIWRISNPPRTYDPRAGEDKQYKSV